MKLIIYLGGPTVQNRRVWSFLWNRLQCRRVWSPSHCACRRQIAPINNSPGSHWILLRNLVCWVDQCSTITLGSVGLALEMEGQDLTSPDQTNAQFDFLTLVSGEAYCSSVTSPGVGLQKEAGFHMCSS
jgi:hypothetical protein